MATPIYVVDAFADAPFSGNPAAVCFPNGPLDDHALLAIAAEMNLSETAFIWEEGDAFRLRWFTPAVEVALCGHATLASAHVLWETRRTEGPIRFETLSGTLTATRDGEMIGLDFPASPSVIVGPPGGLLAGLRVHAAETQKSKFDYLVVLQSEAAVRNVKPDYRTLSEVELRGVMVTAPAAEGADYDFVSRFFAPSAGVDEDPVTGSAHCALGPYWAKRLGRNTLTGFQASARGGLVRVVVDGDRVRLGGSAATVLRGELTV